jgi:Bacterial archaeo-eukaryotic release factor family 7
LKKESSSYKEAPSMNELIPKKDLKSLVESHSGPCVSIYLPTERVGLEGKKNLLRFKNLKRRSEKEILARGLRKTEAAELLAPLERLLKDTLFWQNQDEGLAIFRSLDLFRFFRLPLRFKETLVVADRFHLKPLFPLFGEEMRFYILALSQKKVRLLRADRQNLEEVPLKRVPLSLEEALKYEASEKQLQFHTRTPPGMGRRSAMFHGHGGRIDESKEDLRRFCQLVERGVKKILRGEKAPLVIAGVESILALYREVNSYRNLLEPAVPGNPNQVTDSSLHKQAWKIVQPFFRKAREEAAERYRQQMGTGLASKDIREVIPAAFHGQVEALFVPVGVQLWGTFDPRVNSLQVKEQNHGSGDLLDFAAVYSFLSGGTVYAVNPPEMPDDGPVAALFRYR